MANSVWIGYLGPTQVTSDGSGIVFPGTVTATRFLSGDGTAAAPAIRVGTDEKGLYSPASGYLGFTIGGSVEAVLGAAGWYNASTNFIGWTDGNPFSGNIDTQLARAAARTLTLGPTTGATLRWSTDSLLEIRNFANSGEGNLRANGIGVGVAPLGATTMNTASSGGYYIQSRFVQTSPANGQANFTNWNADAGIGLDFATDAILKVRTRAQTGYAQVDALGYSVSGAAGASGGPFTTITSITVSNGIVTAITGT